MRSEIRMQVKKFKKQFKENGIDKKDGKLLIADLKRSFRIFKNAHFFYTITSIKHTNPERKNLLKEDLDLKEQNYERKIEEIKAMLK